MKITNNVMQRKITKKIIERKITRNVMERENELTNPKRAQQFRL